MPANTWRVLRKGVRRGTMLILVVGLCRAGAAGLAGGQNPPARPARNASPAEFVAYYQERLAINSRDADAWKGLAASEAQLKHYAFAASDYGRALDLDPRDAEARGGLARVLAWNHQYDESIRVYQEALHETPGDAEALEGLARVYTWSNHPREAMAIYQTLLNQNPSNTAYQLEMARLGLQVKDYPAARLALNSVLTAHPEARDVRLELAQLDVRQNRFRAALRQYQELLRANPRDAEAEYGEAKMLYYQGEVNPARDYAAKLVAEEPANFDALFLLATIEHARGRRRQALALLKRADRLSPGNPEVVALRQKLEEESRVTLETGASYAREISRPGSGNPPGFEREDLRTSAYRTTLGMALLPKVDASLSVSYLPAAIPRGGIGGAVAPAQLFYQQTARVASFLTLRGGVGAIRFGPGIPVNFPSGAGPQPGSTVSAIGYAGGTLGPLKKVSLDLTWSHDALPYTPLAVRLGVIESRREAGLNYFLTPRTAFHLTYYRVRDSTEPYAHLSNTISGATGQRVVVNGSDFIKGSGGTFLFNRNLVAVRRFSLDAGYSARFYGYDGPRRGVFLGLFTPSFYQQQLLTAASKGRLWGPLGYDFSGGVGLQQVDQRQALTRALILNPAFTLRAGPRVSFKLGYTYYDVAEAVGLVRGHGVELVTDWKF